MITREISRLDANERSLTLSIISTAQNIITIADRLIRKSGAVEIEKTLSPKEIESSYDELKRYGENLIAAIKQLGVEGSK